ncbi:MAG: hypothetical protein ACHQVK_01860 [Candidatus Paceibacterales bacterium]
MGKRKVVVRKLAAESIAQIAWFIESKGLVLTAERFSDSVYDHIELLADERRVFPLCRDSERNYLGLKCIPFKKKYTIVFLETEHEIVICEFISSKLIRW